MELEFKKSLEEEEIKIAPFKIGIIPSELHTPDSYIILKEDKLPSRRLDLYTGNGLGLYQQTMILKDWIIIGCSYHIIWISKELNKQNTFSFDGFGYFIELYNGRDYILAALGDRILKFDLTANIIWTSNISLDGISINKIEDEIIYCSCEIDPPNGWVEVKVDLATGNVL